MSDDWATLNDQVAHLLLASQIIHQRNQEFSAISGSAHLRTLAAQLIATDAEHTDTP